MNKLVEKHKRYNVLRFHDYVDWCTYSSDSDNKYPVIWESFDSDHETFPNGVGYICFNQEDLNKWQNDPTSDESSWEPFIKTLYKATVMHVGWELDNLAWVEEHIGKRTLYTTDHGTLYEMSLDELNEKIKETRSSLRELVYLRRLIEDN